MLLSSTDFARAIGVSTGTVINWEQKGIVLPVKKTISGFRKYSQEQVQAYLAEDYDNPILTGRSDSK